MSVYAGFNEGFACPVVNGGEVLECIKLGQFDFARQLIEYGKASLEHSKRCASMYSASLRASSASGSSRSGVSAGSGLTGSRLELIAKVDSWRDVSGVSGGVPKSSVVSKVTMPDGYCYAKLLNKSSFESVVGRLGPWPNLGALTRLSVKSFQSLEELERFRLCSAGEGRLHVAAGGREGCSFLDAVVKCSGSTVRQGTLGAAVKSRGVKEATGPMSSTFKVGGCLVSAGRGSPVGVGSSITRMDVMSRVLEHSNLLLSGTPDEAARLKHIEFYAACPSYVELLPELSEVKEIASSQVILASLLDVENEKVVKFVDSGMSAEERVLLESKADEIYKGLPKTVHSGGWFYTLPPVYYFGKREVEEALKMFKLKRCSVSYGLNCNTVTFDV